MLISMLAAAALFAAPEANQGGGSDTQAKPAAEAKPAVKTRKVCYDTGEVSGSRLSRKVCKTEKVEEKKEASPAKAEAEGHAHAH